MKRGVTKQMELDNENNGNYNKKKNETDETRAERYRETATLPLF